VLLPEDLSLVQEGNSGRRSLIDRILSVTNPHYLDALLKYRHIIRQRNQAIRQSPNDTIEITIWNTALAEAAELIWALRADFFIEYEQHFHRIWDSYDSGLEAALIYKGDVEQGNRQAAYLELIEKNLATDIKARRTTRGPHGDKIMCLLNGSEIRNFGSLGEQKLFVSTLKLSEASYIHEDLGMAPVLLLDDLFSTLDQERANMLLERLAEQYQTIISTTHLPRNNLKDLSVGEFNGIVLSGDSK
jgi:DNA replication and repair protein RecF